MIESNDKLSYIEENNITKDQIDESRFLHESKYNNIDRLWISCNGISVDFILNNWRYCSNEEIYHYVLSRPKDNETRLYQFTNNKEETGAFFETKEQCDEFIRITHID